jgi:phosphatidylinositol dimannoside acyltransferase
VLGARVAYLAYRASAEAARRLPASVSRPLARSAGVIASVATPARRAQVKRNLARITDDQLSDDEMRRAVAQVFENYSRYWLELFRSGDGNFGAMELKGRNHLDELSGGAILALPHLGNWDLGGGFLCSQGFPLTVVAETIEPPELFAFFTASRERLGMEVVPLDAQATGKLIKALGGDRLVCLVADRDISGDGVEVEFFGERTKVPGGPALLALRTGAPLLPAAAFFGPQNSHVIEIRKPLKVAREGSLRQDVVRITQELVRNFEDFIRTAPDQWLVLQPNWPSDRLAQ